ncbi:hypothetical protein GIS00_09765 [Nakamurella sp. YIM 132087]|uniref:DUF559 domain-containing protein n=1 Tax=Nakamurella alba TaxID=2665158 RepID=A0A7K1FJC6_9ACTN|nr:type IV toxin-antitoxin system AbiEi family antitoxin domain-containing protein [Nakamurella alba]MTD14232.1 hypothetical protein [Nakamurella alba]
MGHIDDRRLIRTLVEQAGPVVHMRDVDRAGITRATVRRELDRGRLVRVAKASFVEAEIWDGATGWERFRLRSIGFGQCTADDVHLNGWSAVLLLGLPTIGEPPDEVRAIKPGSGRIGPNRTPHGRIRTGHLPPHHRTRRAGIRVVGPSFAAVDIARHHGPTAGLIVADAALAIGGQRSSMGLLVEQMVAYPGIATAQWVAEHADPRTESPLETLGRMAFLSAGRPPPLSNVWIRVGSRRFRVDHLLPDQRIVLEADGALKYDNRPDAAKVVTEQVERERLLRSAGLTVVRYTAGMAWHDPRALLYRVDAEVRRVGVGSPFTDWSYEMPTIIGDGLTG